MVTPRFVFNTRKFCLSSLAIASLSGCGYFSDDWETLDGRCQALSSDETQVAIVSRDAVGFMDTEQGCPTGLDLLGTRFINIEVNGTRFSALRICNQGTLRHSTVMIGRETNTSPSEMATLVKSFTGLTGAKVNIEGRTAQFYKSNFLDACKAVLPSRSSSLTQQDTRKTPSSSHSTVNSQRQELAALQEKDMSAMGYEKVNGEWRKKWRIPASGGIKDEATGNAPSREQPNPMGSEKLSEMAPAKSAVPLRELRDLTEEQDDLALERAKATYLLSHPQSDMSQFVWERYFRPDDNLQGKILGTLRYTTTDPVTHQTVDIDVEIEKDGTPGYALYKPRQKTTNIPETKQDKDAASDTLWPVNAFCTLENGKNIGTYAFPGQDYHYLYTNKEDKPELELTEGLFGVKAFHYFTPFGMGTASYLRFNKGEYDYVLINKDNGRDQEFQGVRVYKQGELIASHACKTPLDLDLRAFPQDSHFDSEKMGDYFTLN